MSGECAGLLDGFRGLSVEVYPSARGRVVASLAALPLGSPVCVSRMLCASPLQENRNRLCSLCLRTSAKRLEHRCEQCQQAWFCAPEDQSSCRLAAEGLSVAPHAVMCPALSHLVSARFDKQLVAMLRLMLELLYASTVGKSAAFDALQADEVSPSDQAELVRPFELLRRAVKSCSWGAEVLLDEGLLLRMFSRIEINVHGIYHGLNSQLVGHAMYPCLLYTSDAADEEDSVDLGGRRIIKKKK
eukprot:TRINITY_DN11455_c0_g1_i3.p1 TRINITY_DN11455_c0_g1~~TRINITY_DN11455_c0_g1_i3.p1  ORF type:complete len:244 (-),score=58.67 TRINITY_DN11455_c0_g1_i3:71-802(-)